MEDTLLREAEAENAKAVPKQLAELRLQSRTLAQQLAKAAAEVDAQQEALLVAQKKRDGTREAVKEAEVRGRLLSVIPFVCGEGVVTKLTSACFTSIPAATGCRDGCGGGAGRRPAALGGARCPGGGGDAEARCAAAAGGRGDAKVGRFERRTCRGEGGGGGGGQHRRSRRGHAGSSSGGGNGEEMTPTTGRHPLWGALAPVCAAGVRASAEHAAAFSSSSVSQKWGCIPGVITSMKVALTDC